MWRKDKGHKGGGSGLVNYRTLRDYSNQELAPSVFRLTPYTPLSSTYYPFVGHTVGHTGSHPQRANQKVIRLPEEPFICALTMAAASVANEGDTGNGTGTGTGRF